MPDFGRMFLKLQYNDLTKNTYIRSLTIMEIVAREKCGLLAVPRTVNGRVTYYPYTAHVPPSVYCPLKRIHAVTAHVKCLEP